MKIYSALSFLLILTVGETYAFSRRRTSQVARPQTTAEQLMTKYTPQPYPSAGRGLYGHANRDIVYPYRDRDRVYPYYGTEGALSYDDYSYSGATNQPEHLGID
ncbi:hypothetical protein H0W26_03715 [Candidatus Dependentiae bacterium]|nr:hypothetical protein [Candidatus Dependentiae bacterium]